MKLNTNGQQHTMSTTMVFQSNDYDKFNMIQGNRFLDMNKIKKILADIDRGTNLLKYVPILVIEKNKKLDIIDGQHRFVVAKKLKSPIFYIMAEDLSLYDIARMNSNTEKWKAKDFINCYTQLGNNNYVILEDLLKKYPGLPITTAISLLASGKVAGGGNPMDAFHRGEFVVKYSIICDGFLKTIDAFVFENKFSRPFMQAISKVIDNGVFDIVELVNKVNQDPEQLKLQDHWRKYLINLEEIVNKGKHKRVPIY
jgi:hypothetical protein